MRWYTSVGINAIIFVHDKFGEIPDKNGIESGNENSIAEQYENKLSGFIGSKRAKMLELIRAIEADQNMS